MATSKSIQVRPKGAAGVQRLKAELATRILASLDRQGLTVREAQGRTGQAAGDFSRLRGGQLERFTIERLLGIAEALGERLTLAITAEGGQGGPALPPVLAGHLRGMRTICRRHGVRRLGAFGAVLRDDFQPVRHELQLAAEIGRYRIFHTDDQYRLLKAALERLLGLEVTLVDLRAMPPSRRKQAIERSLVRIYGPPG